MPGRVVVAYIASQIVPNFPQAAVAAGAFPDIPCAVAGMVQVTHTVQPRADVHAQYTEPYRRYCLLYPGLAGLWQPMQRQCTSFQANSG
jgi:ribulose kinase